MSPLSVSVSRHRDRQRGIESAGEVEAPGGEQHAQHSNSDGLVNIKERDGDKNPSSPASPHLAPPLNRNQTKDGRLTRLTGRKADVVTTPPKRKFKYTSRDSFRAQYARGHSNNGGPLSANSSQQSLVAPPSPGGPSSAGSFDFSLVLHSQPPTQPGTGPAVEQTPNAQGRQLCRQCGQPGRHREGQCVEQWCPGPAGPGTICERCWQKLRRTERRRNLDTATPEQHIPLVPLAPSPVFGRSRTTDPFDSDGGYAFPAPFNVVPHKKPRYERRGSVSSAGSGHNISAFRECFSSSSSDYDRRRKFISFLWRIIVILTPLISMLLASQHILPKIPPAPPLRR